MTVTTLIFFIFFTIATAKNLILMGERTEECTKGGAKFINMSRVEYEYVDDTTYFLNGEIKYYLIYRKYWKISKLIV